MVLPKQGLFSKRKQLLPQASGLNFAPIAQRVKRWPTGLAVVRLSSSGGEIFSTVNRAPLHTAFHYQPLIFLI